ncbi:MAG TPA: serine protease [Candidatus Tumulicola sp.]|nr:serine protease [Candidatus Tumulicola sp.]
MNGRRLLAGLVLGAALAACARGDDGLAATVRRLTPSVVLLSMRIPPLHKGDHYDDAYASGFVVASGSWGSDILTVEHAVDGAWHLQITIGNRRSAPVKVVAVNTKLDVALLRTTASNLPVVPLGSSANLEPQVGRSVALLGYPVPDEFQDEGLGLATSIDTGLLSSVRDDALEVTLSIVPGESGAPVFFSDSGEVIGLADSRFDDEHSIGFAVPIDDAKALLHRADAAHGF